MKITYKSAGGKTVTIKLHNAELVQSTKAPAIWLWRGEEKMNGQMVRRSIPSGDCVRVEN